MNNKVDPQTRVNFRQWFSEMVKTIEGGDFYQVRGDHILIREFSKFCAEKGYAIDEASLGRYLRDTDPVLPTPERCRMLAGVLGLAPIKVLEAAGYYQPSDHEVPAPREPITAS